jgi:alkylation response protein AidB-like acyl-CoA dehydrogenase
VTQPEVVAAVREWVEREVYPTASEYEHADEYPAPLVEDMKRMGLFGVTIRRSTAASASTCSPTC